MRTQTNLNVTPQPDRADEEPDSEGEKYIILPFPGEISYRCFEGDTL